VKIFTVLFSFVAKPKTIDAFELFDKGFVANQMTERTMKFSPIGTNTTSTLMRKNLITSVFALDSLLFTLYSKNTFLNNI
jgi:hypothetical protein